MTTTAALRSVRTARPRFSARGVLDLLAAADARYRSRHYLAAMDDRMLSDIGVTRADVRTELRNALL